MVELTSTSRSTMNQQTFRRTEQGAGESKQQAARRHAAILSFLVCLAVVHETDSPSSHQLHLPQLPLSA